jgi:heat shock protein HtpX
VLGGLLGGRGGVIIAFVFAAVMNFGSYWFSDKIVLRMYRAQAVTPQQAPRLHAIVDGLVARAGLPKPALYLIPEAAPNAFATGRNPQHAAVAVTEGLLRAMDEEEVAGVIAHELAHVQNRDILIASVAATIAGAIGMLAHLAQWGALLGGMGGRHDERGGNPIVLLLTALLAPFVALIIQLAISRSREYAADATGARIAGNPHGLARALEKLGALNKRVPMRQADPATAHLFIVAPLAGGAFLQLFSTHPPLEERIRRLRGY